MIYLTENKNFSLRHAKQTSYNSSWDPKEVADFHETIGNKETPLVKLPGLAKRLGIGSLLLKDESHYSYWTFSFTYTLYFAYLSHGWCFEK